MTLQGWVLRDSMFLYLSSFLTKTSLTSLEQTHVCGAIAERRLHCMALVSLQSFYYYMQKLTDVTDNLYGNDFSVL